MRRRRVGLQQSFRCACPGPDRHDECATTAMLSAVGRRERPAGGGDVAVALLTWAEDIDTVARPIVDRAPVPAATPAPTRRRLPRPRARWWQGGVAALATAAAAVVGVVLSDDHPPTQARVVSISASAAAESSQLLDHAGDVLHEAASTSSTKTQETLVAQARADLQHVRRLLPLLAPADRSRLARVVHLRSRSADHVAQRLRPDAAARPTDSAQRRPAPQPSASGTGTGTGLAGGTSTPDRPRRDGQPSRTSSQSGQPDRYQPGQPDRYPSNRTGAVNQQTGGSPGSGAMPAGGYPPPGGGYPPPDGGAVTGGPDGI